MLFGIVLLFAGCERKEDIPDRDTLIGTYSVIETCTSGNDSYDIIISEPGAGDKTVYVYNLWDWDETDSATINGDNITIPNQLLDRFNFNYSSSILGNILTISLTISAVDESEFCNLICTKK